MTDNNPLTVIVGAGPGLGAALAERFATGGHSLALLSRSAAGRQEAVKRATRVGTPAQGFDCDAADPASVQRAFGQVRDAFGDPSVLIYNAGHFTVGGVLELTPGQFETGWRINCFGAFLAAREVLPAMATAGSGTLLFTGATAALRGAARFAGLASGKFGLRAIAQSMAREFGPRGIHVAHVLIDGQIGTPSARERMPERAEETFLAPDAIAENYWWLYQQPRSTWTQELDLRPHVEKF